MSRNLQAELKAFMNGKSLSLRDIGRAIGISASALSTWSRNSYNGNSARIDTFVKSFLEKQNECMSAPSTETKFVMTSVALKVFEAARICHFNGEIGVCYGDAGLGKTEAVKEYNRQNADVILIEADLGYTAKSLFSELHKRVGLDGFGTVHQMFTDIVQKLTDSGKLIIVDEAEHLPYKALELLRRVYDKARVGILLSGLPRLIYNLRGKRGEYAQLYSRIGIAVRLQPLRSEDTKLIVNSLFSSRNSLAKIYHKTSGGNARTLSKLLSRSQRVAELNDSEITPEIIRETIKLLVV